MSCILAVRHRDTVALAADSFLGNAAVAGRSQANKIFQRGDFNIGVAGSLRLSQVIHYVMPDAYFKHYGTEADVDYYLTTAFATGLYSTLESENLLDDKEFGDESAILLVYKSRIFEIQSDFAIIESAEPFEAIGAGTQAALGAMHTAITLDSEFTSLNAEDIARFGLIAASNFSPYVRGPFDIRTVYQHTTGAKSE